MILLLVSSRSVVFNEKLSKRETSINSFLVGGGSAGCIVAGRLSNHFNVLLLEMGGTPPPAAAVPYYSGAVSQDPSINYFYKSVAQTNASLRYDGVRDRFYGHRRTPLIIIQYSNVMVYF